MSGKPKIPTKLTPELQDKLCLLISEGNYVRVAQKIVGISHGTYHNWMTYGKRAIKAAGDQDGYDYGSDQVYVDFYRAIRAAEAAAEALRISQIQRAGADGCWQAAAWWLERMFPERWGKRDHLQVNGSMKIESGVMVVPGKKALEEWLADDAEQINGAEATH